jgi:hypothetical protein
MPNVWRWRCGVAGATASRTVLASSHSIVDAIPAENYFAMVGTAVLNG